MTIISPAMMAMIFSFAQMDGMTSEVVLRDDELYGGWPTASPMGEERVEQVWRNGRAMRRRHGRSAR
ncbi:hypothetical protein ACFHWW_26130 [Ensifer sp. P24N7]|uniref:hypothetical protein n=1 Tax=Sinorhizobium sp. P24N7 TaxID=3348358 RepID=UPI0035F40FCB